MHTGASCPLCNNTCHSCIPKMEASTPLHPPPSPYPVHSFSHAVENFQPIHAISSASLPEWPETFFSSFPAGSCTIPKTCSTRLQCSLPLDAISIAVVISQYLSKLTLHKPKLQNHQLFIFIHSRSPLSLTSSHAQPSGSCDHISLEIIY